MAIKINISMSSVSTSKAEDIGQGPLIDITNVIQFFDIQVVPNFLILEGVIVRCPQELKIMFLSKS